MDLTWHDERSALNAIDRLQRIGASWLRGFRTHNVAYADDTFTQYKGAQTSAMDQAAHHARSCEVVQMLARLAETRAAHEQGSDPEFTIDQMIERDTGGRDVAARVGSSELIPKRSPAALRTPPKSASTASISISMTSRPP